MKKKSIIRITIMLCIALCLALVGCKKNKHKSGDEWKYDDAQHWHECMTKGHDDKLELGNHEFTKWTVKTPAGYGVKGMEESTCDVCGKTKTRDIDALDAKENKITLKDGINLSKVYDGLSMDLNKDSFVVNGNGKVSVLFKEKTSEEFTETAPKASGVYDVKVMVEGTLEYKACEALFEYTITKKSLTASTTRTYDGDYAIEIAPVGVVEGDVVSVFVEMTKADCDGVVESATLDGIDKDNYTIAIEDVHVTVEKVKIDTSLFNFTAKNASDLKIKLDNSFGIVRKDEVFLEILNAENIKDGTYNLFGSSEKVTDGAFLVMLTGEKSSNYELVDTTGGKLEYKEYHESTFKVVQNNIEFGTFEFTEIGYPSSALVINHQVKGNFPEVLYSNEKYNDKRIIVEVYVGDETGVLLAKYTRSGIVKGEMQVKQEGGKIVSKTNAMFFELNKGVEGFTNEKGAWIHDGEVTLFVKVQMLTQISDEVFIEESSELNEFTSGTTSYFTIMEGPMDETTYEIVMNDLVAKVYIYDGFGNKVEIVDNMFNFQGENGYLVIEVESIGESPSFKINKIYHF